MRRRADKDGMSSIPASFPNGLQLQFGPENANSSSKAIGSSLSSPERAGASSHDSASRGSSTDNMELSQFAELMSGLRTLQKTDPAQFLAILSEIGASISNAAQGAASVGNAGAASVVAQLDSDFGDANSALHPQPSARPAWPK
jgi:hypothetical protein